ncbi:MAG: hypothetical protein ABW221_18830 [Vicinamibacteria bacterium]
MTADRRFFGTVMAVLALAAGTSQIGAGNTSRAPCCRATHARPLAADARTVRRRQGPGGGRRHDGRLS